MNRKTKLLLGAGSLMLGAFVINSCSNSHPPLETVPHVDLDRYMGIWYEIAALPQRYEKGCHCVIAEYKLNPEGYVNVINSCRKGGPNKKLDQAEGKAFLVEGSNNSKLKVQFFWPFKGDYWILELAPDYSYAMVGSPDRESLWFLSRSPAISEELYNRLVKQAKSKGFPVEKLRMTDQSCFK
ncbi:lipocalin family protein [Pontibacter silvestris]|uniref:Lipocalin family protein n=1 Tax=Pontibacter silvestris TaxID=2305183 RepID=A0ABW4X3V6_9BACT|nr:lipocalin family protein [Pontibacter silvestris]MCC9137134.1 lipocalin family protein [Pontibacter silvestris]